MKNREIIREYVLLKTIGNLTLAEYNQGIEMFDGDEIRETIPWPHALAILNDMALSEMEKSLNVEVASVIDAKEWTTWLTNESYETTKKTYADNRYESVFKAYQWWHRERKASK